MNGTAVYVGGNFQGGASVGSTGLRSAGAYDLFVAKLVDAGAAAAVAWAQRAGGPENDFVQTVAVSGANVYAAGTFARTAAFGAASLTSTGGDDLFVAKLTDAGPTGAFTWAQPAGGSGYDVLVAMAVSGPRVYVTGASGGTASFGSARLVSTGPLGSATGFVARLTDAGPTGDFAWVLGTGGRGADYANAVAAGGAQVYVGGTLNGSASFGTHPIADPFSVHIGYLASLTDATGLAAAAPAAPAVAAVFPNPARATATVWVPATAGATQARLILVDALGRAVRARTAALPAAGLRIELDLTGLPGGVYALRVTAGGPATTHRLVVE